MKLAIPYVKKEISDIDYLLEFKDILKFWA